MSSWPSTNRSSIDGPRAVFLELLLLPELLLRAQVRMIGVEAVDELLAVDVLLVCRAAVPEMGVSVDDENLFASCAS